MHDADYQSAGNTLQLDRLSATRPKDTLLARPVPFATGMTQIIVTLRAAGLAWR